MRLAVAEVSGDDDRVEIPREPDGIQLWNSIGGLTIGNDGQMIFRMQVPDGVRDARIEL